MWPIADSQAEPEGADIVQNINVTPPQNIQKNRHWNSIYLNSLTESLDSLHLKG
jgi:hypothetical protein